MQWFDLSCCFLQDVLVLLDLIGSADTKFVNWFSKTQPLYDRLKDIGICSCLILLFFQHPENVSWFSQQYTHATLAATIQVSVH